MEEWRVTYDFPNYNVSNLGNVMNIQTRKILKPTIKGGYCNISLVNELCKKNFKVHRLVAIAFIENPLNKSDVNHKNKNKIDNTLLNLEWMTHAENNQHKSIGLIYTSNRNKQIIRLNKTTGEVLDKYNSIEDAGIWACENKLTRNSHNGRNSISNCLTGLSYSAYGFGWKYIEYNDLENEEWREIDLEKIFGINLEVDKKYNVSSLGRFKNSYGIIMDNYKVTENGYIRICINQKTIALHRLVAFTFLENPENKEQVNHKDGDKLNNSVNNLEWCTNSENQIHKFKIGLGNIFTRKIKQYNLDGFLIKEFNSIVEASKEMGVSKGTIGGVLLGHRKTSAGFIWKYAEDTNLDFSKKIIINPNIGRKVCQYDLEMNLINTHNSISDAARYVKMNKTNIWGVINNLRKTSGGFIWKYLD